MEKEDFLKQIQAIFIDVLDNEEIVINTETTANDVDEWDSLTHIQLIVAIEKHFKVKFLANEIHSWKNVGEMITCIQSKIGK